MLSIYCTASLIFASISYLLRYSIRIRPRLYSQAIVVYWPEGTLSFWYESPAGPFITSQQWRVWVWVRFCVREDFFYAFIYAESTVSTLNNTIEIKVYIHECIFWGCSADTFWEDNLAIFDHKIYP
jgi:hypothetical protein